MQQVEVASLKLWLAFDVGGETVSNPVVRLWHPTEQAVYVFKDIHGGPLSGSHFRLRLWYSRLTPGSVNHRSRLGWEIAGDNTTIYYHAYVYQ